MKSIALFACAIALALVISGCSMPPSEDAGQRLMEKRVADQSGGIIILSEFKKVNGMLNGNLYEMQFEAKVLFPSAGSWQRGSAMDSSVSFGFSSDRLPENAAAGLMAGAMGIVNVKAGERQTVKGILRFQKSERGWVGEDGQVY